jgi:uncharacterized protein (DUF1501 family)
MGGPVAGGKVYGTWPGLDEDELHEGRDLAVTTDFRSVVARVLQHHMKIAGNSVATLFPAAPLSSQPQIIRA